MSEENRVTSPDFIDLAGEIVSAYVANNSVPPTELSALIGAVHSTLAGLGSGAAAAAPAEPETEKPTPAQVRKSITPDGLVSFIDGRSYKTLKRHLSGHGLDPVSYRQRYGLSRDYPVVAANYAAQRSALAKSIGLGQSVHRPVEAETKAPKARVSRKAA